MMDGVILDNIFKKFGVKLAYLFGSQREAGTSFLSGLPVNVEGPSDLDIGVVFGGLPADRFGVYGELFADLSSHFEVFRVDLVFLQETDALFQYEAIRGELVFCADELFLDDYEEMVMKQAADLAYKKLEFESDFLEALRDGYFELAR